MVTNRLSSGSGCPPPPAVTACGGSRGLVLMWTQLTAVSDTLSSHLCSQLQSSIIAYWDPDVTPLHPGPLRESPGTITGHHLVIWLGPTPDLCPNNRGYQGGSFQTQSQPRPAPTSPRPASLGTPRLPLCQVCAGLRKHLTLVPDRPETSGLPHFGGKFNGFLGGYSHWTTKTPKQRAFLKVPVAQDRAANNMGERVFLLTQLPTGQRAPQFPPSCQGTGNTQHFLNAVIPPERFLNADFL